MANLLTIKRGTRAQLNAAAGVSGLNVGEPYLITDEDRIAVGLSASTYEEFAKSSEAGGGGGGGGGGNGNGGGGGGGDTSLDGGFANSVYTAAQTVNGGSASG